LQNTLTDSITVWNYFVNWEKALNRFKNIEMHLNLLNYLIGKEKIGLRRTFLGSLFVP
jgi:type II restriction enzyme